MSDGNAGMGTTLLRIPSHRGGRGHHCRVAAAGCADDAQRSARPEPRRCLYAATRCQRRAGTQPGDPRPPREALSTEDTRELVSTDTRPARPGPLPGHPGLRAAVSPFETFLRTAAAVLLVALLGAGSLPCSRHAEKRRPATAYADAYAHLRHCDSHGHPAATAGPVGIYVTMQGTLLRIDPIRERSSIPIHWLCQVRRTLARWWWPTASSTSPTRVLYRPGVRRRRSLGDERSPALACNYDPGRADAALAGRWRPLWRHGKQWRHNKPWPEHRHVLCSARQ